MKTRHKNFLIKGLKLAAEIFDFAQPVLEYAAKKLEKKSGSKHKKAFKTAAKKYLDEDIQD